MPNDCTNIITIICKNQENLSKFIENELQTIKNYNSENHEIVKILKQGKYGIILNLWSAWKPDYEWTEKLLNTYEDFWIKNAWHEEGGMAGVWIGFTTEDNEIDIKHLTWRDLSIEEEYYLLNDTS
jgi:hypothetical protein